MGRDPFRSREELLKALADVEADIGLPVPGARRRSRVLASVPRVDDDRPARGLGTDAGAWDRGVDVADEAVSVSSPRGKAEDLVTGSRRQVEDQLGFGPGQAIDADLPDRRIVQLDAVDRVVERRVVDIDGDPVGIGGGPDLVADRSGKIEDDPDATLRDPGADAGDADGGGEGGRPAREDEEEEEPKNRAGSLNRR